MSVDPAVLAALSKTLEGLRHDAPRPIPAQAIATLTPLAKPGMRLRIDLAASKQIGAPLVTLTQTRRDLAFLDP